MANPEHLATLLLGVDVWNEWREREAQLAPDLSGLSMPEADLAMVNLGGANLRGADLHGADLSGANLSGADLGGANLRGATLRGADLNWAYLCDADLRGCDLAEALLADANLNDADLVKADLSGADLHGADLRGANLISAHLDGANFEEAGLAFTKFGDVDLSAAKGLAQARHVAPSTIGIDAFYRSKGLIPEPFLRGAGVPDNFIAFINGMSRRREPAFSCFIAHSTKDQRFCDRLYVDLQAYGVRTWYFPEDVPTGKRFFAEIVVRVRMFDKIVAVCSRNSLQSTKFVQELERSLKREQEEQKRVLYPIRLDNYILKEWRHGFKTAVIDRTVADFRGWPKSLPKYEEGLKSLLTALKAS